MRHRGMIRGLVVPDPAGILTRPLPRGNGRRTRRAGPGFVSPRELGASSACPFAKSIADAPENMPNGPSPVETVPFRRAGRRQGLGCALLVSGYAANSILRRRNSRAGRLASSFGSQIVLPSKSTSMRFVASVPRCSSFSRWTFTRKSSPTRTMLWS